MQTMRIVGVAALVVVSVASTSFAQRIDAPGDYNVNVVVDPRLIPGGMPSMGPEVYSGTVTITDSRQGPKLRFRGRSQDGHKVNISATFMSGWAGMLVSDYYLGPTLVSNAVIGIDVSWMMEAKINGVGVVDGVLSRVNARFGQSGMVLDMKVRPI